MYGKKRYRALNKPVEQPVVDNSVPTFVCPHCKLLKTIDMPHVELTALDNGKLFMYTKLCSPCAEILKTWIKQ